jgi:heme exporter protein B
MSLLLFELKFYIKNFKEAIYIYSFFISIALMAPFAVQSENIPSIQSLAPVILWTALASGIALAGMGLFQRDAESGRLEYYQLLPISLERLVLVKWVAFYLFIVIPLLLCLPVMALIFNIPVTAWGHYAAGLAAGAAALTAITCLVAALMAGLARAGGLLSLIILPLCIPVMIFGGDYCRQTGALFHPDLVFLLGLTAFLLPIAAFIGASSIRHSN